MAIFEDPAREADLRLRGYTIVPLLDPEAVAGLWDSLVRLREQHEFARTDAAGAKLTYHASFMDRDQDYRIASIHLIRERLGPPLAKVLPGFDILMGCFHIKPPGTGHVGIHKDWTVTENVDELSLNVWCPLVDVDDSNGTLRMIEGSHGLYPHIAAPGTHAYWQDYIPSLEAASKPLSLKAGEAVIYDSTVLHWSKPNMSGSTRAAVGLSAIRAGSRPVFHVLDSAAGGSRFETFDMSGDAFLSHPAADLYAGQITGPRLGFVENRNRPVPHAEFRRDLERAWRGRGGAPRTDGAASRLRSLAARLTGRRSA